MRASEKVLPPDVSPSTVTNPSPCEAGGGQEGGAVPLRSSLRSYASRICNAQPNGTAPKPAAFDHLATNTIRKGPISEEPHQMAIYKHSSS
jgi:hypothetical protein